MPAQDERGRVWLFRRLRWLAVAGALISMLVGCTRRYYRDFADRDVYRIERERLTDWRWQLPDRPVEADPSSRMGDKHDPNHEPIPPDDPGARPFQVTAGRPFEFHGWKKRGVAPVEDLAWLKCLARDKDGNVVLDGPAAMRMALMNSRNYQTEVENVYLSALQLTLSRFQFFPQIFSNQTTQYRHFGATNNESNQLQLLAQDGLNWTFYSGAQLLVNFANNLIFEYDGRQFQTVSSGLTLSLIQPLLQGAWARNVTQPLSLQERQTLYVMRTFAAFRRQFYVNVNQTYLGLLLQLQQIRNTQDQLEQYRRNIEETEALVRAGLVDQLQADNIAQQYQGTLASLLSQEANYQTTLDAYRVDQLGLPADFPLKLDESLLKPFELNDPRIDTVRKDNEVLNRKLLQHDEPPSREVMADAARELLKEYAVVREISGGVGKELARWKKRIEAEKKDKVGSGPGPTEKDERESLEKQVQLSRKMTETYKDSLAQLDDNVKGTEAFIKALDKADPDEAWDKLRRGLVTREFRGRLAEQYLVQTQVRMHLIEVKPVDLSLDDAISVALGNRLDLMNSLGGVTDAWRNVEFAGNQLLAGLNVFYNGQLNSAPKSLELIQLDAHQSQHLVGIQFSAPINRRVQRNDYRANQIAYQRARRAYMLNHDQVVQQIRLDMRNLNLQRRQFEISRNAMLIAVRQVEQAEYLARTSTGASSGAGQVAGNNLIIAQQALLSSKNGLIGTWIQYEIERMTLYKDFDVMNIDSQGVWTNDGSIPTFNGGPVPSAPDPLRPPSESLLPGPASGDRSSPDSFVPPPTTRSPSPFSRP